MSEAITRLNEALEGRYRIDRTLGEGGMATVYLAEDLKHSRHVAMKVLKPELAAVIGGERFLAEIQTTANLQHPHILPLFDSGEADTFLYYVMPYVDGESLRDKLDRERQMGVDEALHVARAVASALQYAHDAGIVHRDIKPENILLHAGQPVVADFGIALAVSAAGGGRMTETGLSLGTPHYMSPEQATADRDLTNRSDIYALACVLYEMLAGDPPHTGPTPQSILMRILTEPPRPVTQIRASVPPQVSAALAKALEKLPADRFERADDFAKALDDRSFSYTAAHRAPTVAGTPAEAGRYGIATGTGWGRWKLVTLTAIPALMVGLSMGRSSVEPPVEQLDPPVRFELEVPGDQRLAFGVRVDVSPNGEYIAYDVVEPTGGLIHVRRADEPTWRPIEGTEDGGFPTFSPDGEWLAFSTTAGLMKVPIDGGPVFPLVTQQGPAQPNWADDGTIVYEAEGGIYRVSENGGTPELVLSVSEAPDNDLDRPELLPGGRGLLVSQGSSTTWIVDLETREATRVADGGHAHYVGTGHIVYGAPTGALMAVPFDLDRLEVTGDPSLVLPSVQVSPGGGTQFAVSRTGLAVYFESAGPGVQRAELVMVEPGGAVTPLEVRQDGFNHPRFSPDGNKIAYGSDRSIWIYDLVLGSNTQLTFDDFSIFPSWSRDGEFVYYSSRRESEAGGFNIFRKAANGGAAAEALPSTDTDEFVLAEGPDGHVLTRDDTRGRGQDLRVLAPGSEEHTPYLTGDWNEFKGSLSPDGRWLAYTSDQSGMERIYVRSFPEPGEPFAISPDFGIEPVWSPDGQTIYYRSREQLTAAELRIGESVTVLGHTVVASTNLMNGGRRTIEYDIDPDGSRFIFVRRVGRDSEDEAPELNLVVVANWFTELLERTGQGR